MKNLFLNEKKALVMMNLLSGADYIRHIAESSNTMYPHALQTLKLLEKKGYVNSAKEGRIRMYQLTEEGEKVASLIQELWELTQNQEVK
ncbi:MAG: winged helix-turn-helix transcriptional regulator [Theionarchaea archaeon]|nr:winged helix-turn-helix transcriptional regulator [Theionarchaea archaeon]MBU6999371.1 winged helix-turn-helix transcriptional regulator [Theionarchaea archaeon]MBU7021363.1 winged helix-turn-helix transcriptional regulator [Theionarchaea archaeon]MBU7035991.1 winged helix-turn-helix transcriptional regulator [Theionarchaea archaeon]